MIIEPAYKSDTYIETGFLARCWHDEEDCRLYVKIFTNGTLGVFAVDSRRYATYRFEFTFPGKTSKKDYRARIHNILISNLLAGMKSKHIFIASRGNRILSCTRPCENSEREIFQLSFVGTGNRCVEFTITDDLIMKLQRM